MHKPFAQIDNGRLVSTFDALETTPNQLRWNPLPMPAAETDFVGGLTTVAGNGDLFAQTGIAIHIFACNKNMTDRFFYNADGEMLMVACAAYGAWMLHPISGAVALCAVFLPMREGEREAQRMWTYVKAIYGAAWLLACAFLYAEGR